MENNDSNLPFYHFYYAPTVLKNDISYRLYKTSEEATEILKDLIRKTYPRFGETIPAPKGCNTRMLWYPKEEVVVYLLSVLGEIFVSSDIMTIVKILDRPFSTAYSPIQEDGDIHLFEFLSFEEAYKCALDMKETSPLCYEK